VPGADETVAETGLIEVGVAVDAGESIVAEGTGVNSTRPAWARRIDDCADRLEVQITTTNSTFRGLHSLRFHRMS
jgi:hypothetical protein